jgi:hypothetical protein
MVGHHNDLFPSPVEQSADTLLNPANLALEVMRKLPTILVTIGIN